MGVEKRLRVVCDICNHATLHFDSEARAKDSVRKKGWRNITYDRDGNSGWFCEECSKGKTAEEILFKAYGKVESFSER